MNRTKTIYATIYLICLIAFTGCASKLAVKPLENKESRLSLSVELGKNIESALDEAMSGLTQMDQSQNKNTIFDLPSIKKSLTDAGYKDIEISSPSRTALNLSFSGTFDFVEYDDKKTTVTITPETMQKFSNSFGEEFKSIMDLFMAPVLTDEKMTAEEYSELVAVVYGQNIADEMLESRMEISVSTKKGKTKKYTIPVSELLILSEEKIFVSE